MDETNTDAALPVLTLEPFDAAAGSLPEASPAAAQMAVPEKKAVWDEPILSDAEKEQIEAFALQIDITNSASVMQYGAGAQKKMADFSAKALDNVRNQDLGETGELLSGVINELRSFDASEDKGFFGFFKKGASKLSALKTKYEKTEATVENVCRMLEERQMELMKDAAMLDKMYELNKTYFKELSMYILAGKKRLDQIRSGRLSDLVAEAKASGRPEAAQEAKDLESLCARFEKKLYDLELTRTISLQAAPQIRLVQDNDTVMAEKIQSVLVNTIPLWKNQMVIALGIEHSVQAMQAQRAVTDMTNMMLRKNAERLKAATIETAREAERGIVDIETLKAANESLITTLDEVVRIQDEGRLKRLEAESEMGRIERDLKEKLIGISGRQLPE